MRRKSGACIFCADAATMNVKTNEKTGAERESREKKIKWENIFIKESLCETKWRMKRVRAHIHTHKTKPKVFIILVPASRYFCIAFTAAAVAATHTQRVYPIYLWWVWRSAEAGGGQANADENYKVTIRHTHRSTQPPTPDRTHTHKHCAEEEPNGTRKTVIKTERKQNKNENNIYSTRKIHCSQTVANR